MIEVILPGPLTTVQDLGRAGLAHLGVPGSGAADLAGFGLANRLAGNPPGAAALELTLGGAVLRFGTRAWIAVTGAPAPLTIDGRPCGLNAPCFVRAGSVVALGTPVTGLRTYLAVRGGLDVEPVLGSRSTDLLSGLGPAPLAAGDRLPVGRAGADFGAVDVAPVRPPPDRLVLRVRPGPHHDWFTGDALTTGTFEVTSQSNRVGVRLDGPPLGRARVAELPSEGMVTGAIQVPPGGQPILFLADHPTTGGYPVIAVVAAADLSLAAQLRPGQTLRLSGRPYSR
ncbi:MAG: biotin-dependent carboxyltransferase family protein [Streptosporangiaceae bacterium]